MDSYEFPAFISALFMLAMVMVGRIMSTSYLMRLKEELHLLEETKHHHRNRLKIIKNEHAIARANLNVLTKKKAGFVKRRVLMEKEIEENNEEELRRQERYGTHKVK